MRNPFGCFKTSPEIIRLTVMIYDRFPLSRRQVEELLHEPRIDISHARCAVLRTVRVWLNRFGPMFARDIGKKRSAALRVLPQWRWHLEEAFVLIDGEPHYPWPFKGSAQYNPGFL